MNKILYIFLFGLIFLIALVFSLQNLDLVKVYFYRGGGKGLAIELRLALVPTLELLAGVLIGYTVLITRYLKLKAENVRLNEQVQMNMAGPAADNQ